jgi:hypothetical protein
MPKASPGQSNLRYDSDQHAVLVRVRPDSLRSGDVHCEKRQRTHCESGPRHGVDLLSTGILLLERGGVLCLEHGGTLLPKGGLRVLIPRQYFALVLSKQE